MPRVRCAAEMLYAVPEPHTFFPGEERSSSHRDRERFRLLSAVETLHGRLVSHGVEEVRH